MHRSDGSGTTYNFTKHLSAISPEWNNDVGASKSVQWPTGVGAKGNEGVAAQLTQIDGGIGYVELAYVKGDLQAAAIQNGSGKKVVPTNATANRALGSIDLGPNLIGSNANQCLLRQLNVLLHIIVLGNDDRRVIRRIGKIF